MSLQRRGQQFEGWRDGDLGLAEKIDYECVLQTVAADSRAPHILL